MRNSDEGIGRERPMLIALDSQQRASAGSLEVFVALLSHERGTDEIRRS
jgi:hypothetical protein